MMKTKPRNQDRRLMIRFRTTRSGGSGWALVGGPVSALVLAISALTSSSFAWGGEALPTDEIAIAEPSMSEVFGLIRENKLMPALVMLERLIASDLSTLGSAAQFWAFSGDVATADALFARASRAPQGPMPDLSQAQFAPAIAEIVRVAKGKRIVMINEAHHAPRHRAFTHQLLLALHEEGFTHFAAETFCNGCPKLLEEGAPTTQTGSYVADPVFGDLVRQASKAGIGLVAYERMPEQAAPLGVRLEETIARREQAQAENLKAALDAEPSMRVVVHVGFGHLNEGGARSSTAMFADRLKQLTGEDPLTIDQTEGTRQADPEHDSPLFRAFLQTFGEPDGPVVIRNNPDRPLGSYAVDLSVVHPFQREANGRPDWLALGGYRKPYDVQLRKIGTRTLLRAFVAGEPDSAIPMDQVLIGVDREAVTLMLPAGTYRLVRQTEAGENLELGTITTG